MMGEMSLNLKQGSSLLDDDDENSSSMKGLQQQTTILGSLAEEKEEVSDHDTEEDSDDYYEEEHDSDSANAEEGNNEEEIPAQALTGKEKEDNESLVSNNIVNLNAQSVEDLYTKELPDVKSSSAVDCDPKMSLLSTFLNRGITTKTSIEEKTEKVTTSTSEERESDETPLFPTVSDAGATSAASSCSPPAPQAVIEEAVLLQISPSPTGKRAPERKEETETVKQDESHSAFSDEDYEFFSTYLNERDKKTNFEHASCESLDATVCEQDAVSQLNDEDNGTEDVFKPTIPIEEQFLMQEERAARSEAIRSTTSLARTFNNVKSKNVAKSSSKSLPPPSFAAALAKARKEEEEHHKRPLPSTRISSQLLPPQESPAVILPVLPINVLSAAFPPEKYSFTSRKGLEKIDYEEEKEERGAEDSIVCYPSHTSELPLSPLQASPGLIAEASAAASKIISQAESSTDKFKRTAFAIEVKMMKEETKGLHCYELVCALFGEDDDNLTMPPPDMIKKLKNAIEIELTIKRFRDYKEVVDINTAELFMKDKNALEDICRQQIMSNPLLSSLDYDNSVPHKTSKNPQENASDSASIDSEINAIDVTTAGPVMETPQVALYQEFTNIITDSSENTNPAARLNNKISFLKNILTFKIGNMCNLSKILNLVSFIIKQALITIGGGATTERVLLHSGNNGSSFYSDAIGEEPSLSSVGIGLLFGTLLGGVNSVIIRSCVSVARLAMTMGVPIVMLNWPQEFKASKDYENILRESILKFKHTFNVSPSFILDSVFGVKEEEEEKETPNNTPTVAMSILTGKEKAKIIRDYSINDYSDRHFFGLLFDSYCGHKSNKKQKGGTLEMPMELLYQNASSVIEHKNRITDNMLSGIVDYLEENKILVSKILNRLITQAGLAATMYYINSSSVRKSNHGKKNKSAQKTSERVYKGNSAFLKKSEEKGISSVRTILASRRGVMGGGSGVNRGKLRSMMPVIAAPQKVISAKPSGMTRHNPSEDN